MRDIYIDWHDASDPVLLQDDAAIRQQVYCILFFRKDECVFDRGDEINLSNDLFEMIPFDGGELTIRSISDRITAFDSRFKLIESQSSVEPVGDQYQMHLVIEYDYNKSIELNPTVEVS